MIRKTALALLLAAAGVNAHAALNTGDIAFTGFNADFDHWSIVTNVDIAANTTIYFGDNEWTGSKWADTNEHTMAWNTGTSVIKAGTVILFTENVDLNPDVISASVGTLSLAAGTGSNYGISASDDTIYAFLGSSAAAPTTFLAGLTTESSATNLTNAGLTVGSTAVKLTNSTDFAQYTGLRNDKASFAEYASVANNAANWNIIIGGDQSAQVIDTTAFTLAVPEPKSYAMLFAGLGLMGAIARRRTRR
ncbi:PEP-CTERM sorting domain-containing protein [Ferribacterium limneticum]|uniref:PEP-CTERM sorting domain-containing protein n=1 Tax=Ferribacterium limneticum TaxID=76259 RepID=UPI001CF9C5C4|nr:PEP-CTERM sorting domain-containing protein [Ferribacterium limneticum]UCV29997.1 PEP-CTERM sorting domain-containing protein [Ferribacterium limneticum]UCV33916.1 PEP-CTERM sorting domain-containing protein [Ferribacterium limneticum]